MTKGNGSAISYSDRVHQAQGMVSVQAACSMDDTLALMQSTAEAAETTLDHVAADVVSRRVRFD